MPFKSEKQRRWMHANNPKMAAKWEKEEKKMKETKVKELIRKMVREMMSEIDEGFAGGLSKGKRKAFDSARQKQSEVLGYKLTGTSDVKTEIGDATIDEGSCGYGINGKVGNKPAGPHLLKKGEEELSEAPKFKNLGKNLILPNDMGTKKKVSKIIKKLKLKIDKDYGVKALDASGKKQKITITKKQYDKFLELLMNAKIKVRSEEKIKEENLTEVSKDTFVNILTKFGFTKGARDWGGHHFFVHKSKGLYATYHPAGRSIVIEPKRGGKPVFDSDRSNFSIRALLSYLQSPSNKFVSTEGKLNEFNKAHFLNLIKQDLESKKGQLAYANDKIRYSGTPKWERKEWLNVSKDLKKEIKVLQVRVKQVSKMEEGKLLEKAKRDYKAEYKKFQSSTKSKKYRAELNAYNRKKGTYGNGDGKDASHKGGKIVGFEAESKNRGRAEKSRLKKEGKLTETKFYAFWNRKKYPIDGKSLWDAKKKAIEKLKIPKSKYGLLAIMNADEHDRMSKISWVKQEGKLNEEKPYETILKQLGGNRFVAMTGAKNLGTNGKDLSFSIGRNAKKVTHVHIKLTSMDLYDVEFINMRGVKRKVIKKVKGVYGDMLPKIFKKYTGMNVRL